MAVKDQIICAIEERKGRNRNSCVRKSSPFLTSSTTQASGRPVLDLRKFSGHWIVVLRAGEPFNLGQYLKRLTY